MMEHLIYSRHKRLLSAMLIGAGALYGLTTSTHTNAAEPYQYIAPDLEAELCMADAYLAVENYESNRVVTLPQDALNCTANDVEITKIDEESIEYCNPGDVVEFYADVTVRTNANERYDTTFYNSLSGQSPQFVQVDKGEIDMPGDGTTEYPYYCSVLLPLASEAFGPAYVDLDSDVCGDITKANGVDSYTLPQQKITMLCEDVINNDNKADFRYCAAWDNTDDNVCDLEEPVPGQVPNTKSKCNCDILTTNIFIKPNPPDIEKSLVSSSSTTAEPGGEFEFSVSFTNQNQSSLFITSVFDHIDIGADGTYGNVDDTSFNLWGETTDPTTIDELTPEGVYLTATTCLKPAADANSVEVVAGGTYSCNFKVYKVKKHLPGGSEGVIAPAFPYDDIVALTFVDEFGDAVVDGETCPTGLTGVEGRFCSDEETVSITNVEPNITVTKTPMINGVEISSILEPGASVTFEVEVINSATSDELWDSPLTLTSLSDTDFDLLNVGGDVTSTDCTTVGITIPANDKYTCSFTAWIAGDAGQIHSNTVTAIARDSEYSTDTKMATATLNINDVPSEITLVKTAGDAPDGEVLEIPETGDNPANYEDVVFKFLFSVEATSVDYVTFDKLEDVVSINAGVPEAPVDLTNSCLINWKKAADGTITDPDILLSNGDGFVLYPGESASCEITLSLQGNAEDTYMNVATIYGVDSDEVAKQASDPADILFIDEPLLITPEFALKARAFVRIPNGGNENVDITSLKIGEIDLADQFAALQAYIAEGTVPTSKFLILDESGTSGYSYGDITGLPFCSLGEIGYGQTYDCAFTIMFFSGFAGEGNVLQSFSDDGALKVLLDDDEESSAPVEAEVGLEFVTDEP